MTIRTIILGTYAITCEVIAVKLIRKGLKGLKKDKEEKRAV